MMNPLGPEPSRPRVERAILRMALYLLAALALVGALPSREEDRAVAASVTGFAEVTLAVALAGLAASARR